MAKWIRSAVFFALPCLLASRADAGPYRLRGDALGQARAPAGLVMLQGDAAHQRWLDAEALVWTGHGELGSEADVLVATIDVQDPERGHQARLGRFVLVAGALRPVHIDGLLARARLPWDTIVEGFAGMPVVPRFGEREYDWLAGGRISQRFGDLGVLGAAYMHRRDRGVKADEELGLDLALYPLEWFDLGARAAYDLINPGLSELRVSTGLMLGDWRIEALASHRSPSRILPATSLFSVLGDIPSELLSIGVRWRAAPRLDLIADAGARRLDEDLGEELRLRAILRLDEFGRGALGLEARRSGTPGAEWSGLRGTLRVPIIADYLAASTEVELAWRDDADSRRGKVWPWGLVALGFTPTERWEIAAAIEASATPEYEYAVDGLVRIAYAWSAP